MLLWLFFHLHHAYCQSILLWYRVPLFINMCHPLCVCSVVDICKTVFMNIFCECFESLNHLGGIHGEEKIHVCVCVCVCVISLFILLLWTASFFWNLYWTLNVITDWSFLMLVQTFIRSPFYVYSFDLFARFFSIVMSFLFVILELNTKDSHWYDESWITVCHTATVHWENYTSQWSMSSVTHVRSAVKNY